MAFFLLCIAVFVMFFPAIIVIPAVEAFSPVKTIGISALFFYIILGEKSDKPFLKANTNKYLLLFIVMQILSSASIWLRAGFTTFNFWLRYGIVYYLIVKSGITEKKIVKLCFTIVLSISYIAIYSINNFVLQYEPGMRARGLGWYENANDLAVIMVTVLPLAFMIGEISKSAIIKYLFWGIAGLFSIDILFTGSRNGLLGLTFVGGLSILTSEKASRIIKLFLSGILILSIVSIGISTVLNRGDLSGLSGDESSENRLIQWSAAWRMLKAHPILGVGPGESAFEMNSYGGVKGLQPHNTIVQVFAETGFPGGIFFMLFAIYPLCKAVKTLKQKKQKSSGTSYTLYRYIFISLMGFWICAIFSNRVTGYILYVLIALLVAVEENLISKNAES